MQLVSSQGAELFAERAAVQEKEIVGFTASAAITRADFADIYLGMRMGANINAGAAMPFEDYEPFKRLKSATELKRLLDARAGTRGPTPSFSMSCLIGVINERATGSDTPIIVLNRSIRSAFASFMDKEVVLSLDGGSESEEGICRGVVSTGFLVDRTERYTEYYPHRLPESYCGEPRPVMVREQVLRFDYAHDEPVRLIDVDSITDISVTT